MLDIDPLFDVSPLVNKTISRIYRDTRFSNDKSPYKTTHWLTFKRPCKTWKSHPAYFFELSPESYRFGMGFYSADRINMDRFREKLDADPQSFIDVVGFFDKGFFALEGESYKHPIKSGIPAVLQDWYHRKSFYLVSSYLVKDRIIPAIILDQLKTSFKMLAPLYQYLTKAIQS